MYGVLRPRTTRAQTYRLGCCCGYDAFLRACVRALTGVCVYAHICFVTLTLSSHLVNRIQLARMDQFQSMMNQAAMGGGQGAGAGGDAPQHDNAEMIYISSLALLKVRRRRKTSLVVVRSNPPTCLVLTDAQTWSCWCAHGGDGSDAGRVCR